MKVIVIQVCLFFWHVYIRLARKFIWVFHTILQKTQMNYIIKLYLIMCKSSPIILNDNLITLVIYGPCRHFLNNKIAKWKSSHLPSSLLNICFFKKHSASISVQFSLVQLLSHVWFFATTWTAAPQASLSITNSQCLPKPMSIESVMPSNHLTLCCPLLLLPSIFPNIRFFSNESALRIRWPKYWSLSFNISLPQSSCSYNLLHVRGSIQNLQAQP